MGKPRGASTSDEEPLSAATINKLLEKHLKPIDAKLSDLNTAIQNLKSRMAAFEEEQKEHAHSLNFLGDEITDIKAQLEEVQQQSKATEVDYMQDILERMEHDKRARSVELYGIPYGAGENLMEAASRIIKKLDLEMEKDNIDQIYRIKQTSRVIIRFLQSHRRDEFWAEFKNKQIGLKDLGFKDDGKLYINEVLSKSQYELLYKARNFKKANKFKYLWTRNQRIYLRKTQDTDVIEVKSFLTLTSLAEK
jgi:hypothetical protein